VEVRELRSFVAVAEEGGLSPAARRLHVSQSALSQTIQSIERQLGLQLLIRTSTGTRLTEVGSVLLTEARELLAHHDRVIAKVVGSERETSGALHIGVPLELPADLLPGALSRVRATLPERHRQLGRLPVTGRIPGLLAARWEGWAGGGRGGVLQGVS
jgi:DNA-binding transcriptional LysR family regulator